MEIRRHLPDFLKPLGEREVVSGVQFSEVVEAGNLIDPGSVLGGVKSANQDSWGILIRWNKTRWGLRGFNVAKEEVIEKLSRTYSVNKLLTTTDQEIYQIIQILDGKAIEVASRHVREINSGEF